MGYRFGGTLSSAPPLGTRSHSISSPGEGRFRNSFAQKLLPATPLRGAAANSLAGSQRLCTDALGNSQRLYSAPGRPLSGPKGGTTQELAEQIPGLLKGLGGPPHVQVCKDPFPLRRSTPDAEDTGLAPRSGGLGATVRPKEQWQPNDAAALMSQTLPSDFGKRPASNEARPASWPNSMWPGQRRPSPGIQQRQAAGEESLDTGGGAACGASPKTSPPAAQASPQVGRTAPWESVSQRRVLEVLTQPGFEASAQAAFRLHDAEGEGRVGFAKLCSAVSALRLDLDLPKPDTAHLGQLFKEFGFRENTTLNFSDFLKFFKEDLSQSVTDNKSNTANGPVNFKEFFALCKEGGGGSAPPQGQADTAGAASAEHGVVGRQPSAPARAPARRQGADAPEEEVPFSFVLGKPRLREQRRTRRRTAEALMDPDLEAFSRDAFSARARDGNRQLGIDQLLEVLDALHAIFDLAEPDDDAVCELLQGHTANGEESLNFTHFFGLFKDELRRSALDACEDDMPLSFRGFFEILGGGSTKL